MKAFSAGRPFVAVEAAGEMSELAVDLEVAGIDAGRLQSLHDAGAIEGGNRLSVREMT